MNLLRIPIKAWPGLIRSRLSRQVATRVPASDISDADLDYFMGGTDAVEARYKEPTFQFFPAEELGPAPSPEVVEGILAHRVYLLGETFDVGQPIKWRQDFRTGYEWPKEHISKFNLVTTQGDVKLPWELSRFQQGLGLARAYAATGEMRYATEWAGQFRQWLSENPPEIGPNWGIAMEAAIRAVNWIAAYSYVRPALNAATSEALLKALIQHGRFIASHLEEYWPPTNHIIADWCGLVWIGLFLKPEGKNERASAEPKRWLDMGWRGLQNELRRQVLADGADYEASTAYHRFVTEMVKGTVQLMELNGMFVAPEVRQIVSQMESVTLDLQKPDGSLPLFGDEDGGYFPAPSLTAQATITAGWRSFAQGGWYIYRNGEEYLAIRAGNNGQAGWGGHAHNDALSFEYAIGTRTFLVDPGTYAYTSDAAARDLFRSTAYHNTLKVDGAEISRILAGKLFKLENDVVVKAGIKGTNWEGEHRGYSRLGVTHKRQFEKQSNGWLIRDVVTGSGVHTLEWNFHFAAGCPVKIEGLEIQTEFFEGPNLRLSGPTGLTPELSEGWVSRTYGAREKGPVARYTLKGQLPVEVTFIISKI